jgi:radical SAM protein with 4Fe4S-binding SPASM domain
MPISQGFDFLVQWHLTERCNLRCTHCYQGDTLPGEMSSSEVTAVLDEISDTFRAWEDAYGIPFSPSFNITGGEPFVRTDLPHILDSIAKRRYEIFLLTNGTLVNRGRATMLAGLGVKSVQVSIEGPDDIHDSIRGEGSFGRAVDGIDHLLDAGLKVTVNVTLSRLNARCMRKVVAFASHMGVHRVGFSRLVPCGRGGALTGQMLDPREVKELYHSLFSLEVRNLEIVTGDPVAAQLRPVSAPRKRYRKKNNADGVGPVPRGGCAAGVSGLTLLSDGTIVPCRRMGIPVGNVRNDSIREVWATSPVLEALRDKSRYTGKCGSCERWENCRGCRAVAYAHSRLQGRDDFLADDPQCFHEI